MKYLPHFLWLLFASGFIFNASAQNPKKKTRIEVLNADVWEFESGRSSNAERLIGNVRFKHEGAIMKCDSAYLFKERNSISAWGNIHINQADSVQAYGDSLRYNGDTREAVLKGNVRLIDPQMNLTTSYLKYNLGIRQAHYAGGGTLINHKNNNTLTSGIGVYHTTTNDFYFRDSVVLISPDYTIYSDTLRYNTASEITWFFGPTLIKGTDNTIYCENGWYNTKANTASFSENAWMETEGQLLKGDSLYYDRGAGLGKAFGNVMVEDTVEKVTILGQKAFFWEKADSSVITGRPEMIMAFANDSMHMHGDTLIAVNDSVTGNRTLTAYHNVKFFKPDMQGKCDSMIFTGSDSLIRLYNDPVLWAEESQITAEHIRLKIYDGKVERMDLLSMAFIINQDDTFYNQIKGKEMTGYFTDNNLSRVDVRGNGETLYFTREDSGAVFGMNRAVATDLRIYLKEREIEEIIFLKQPVGVLTPLKDVDDDEMTLKDFRWRSIHRPLSRDDIFIRTVDEPSETVP